VAYGQAELQQDNINEDFLFSLLASAATVGQIIIS
jgi:hypothetical protein